MAEKTYFGTFPKIITPGSLSTILYYIEKMALETAIPMGGVTLYLRGFFETSHWAINSIYTQH